MKNILFAFVLAFLLIALTGCSTVINNPPETDYAEKVEYKTVVVIKEVEVPVVKEVEIIREVEIPTVITEYIEIEKNNSLPTLEQVREFILSDKTSSKVYLNGIYECRHFATDVNNNAEIAGFKCAFVILCFRTYQHAVVAFETSDIGLIFIEPQSDAAIHPKVGGYYQDQEILEILICW